MAQDPTTLKSAATADYDAVMTNLAALRDEMTKLAASIAKTADKRAHTLAEDVGDGMTEAVRYVSRKGHEADDKLEQAIAANPYVAIGLAAAAGLLLGYATRK